MGAAQPRGGGVADRPPLPDGLEHSDGHAPDDRGFARWTLGEGGYAIWRAIIEVLLGGAPGHDGASVTGILLQASVPLAAAVAVLRRRGLAQGGLLVPAAFAAVYTPVMLFMNWRLIST